jgi:hypothetical protein
LLLSTGFLKLNTGVMQAPQSDVCISRLEYLLSVYVHQLFFLLHVSDVSDKFRLPLEFKSELSDYTKLVD